MANPFRVTLSADPFEGRVLPSAVFVRPPDHGPFAVRFVSRDADDRSDDRDRGDRHDRVRLDDGPRGWGRSDAIRLRIDRSADTFAVRTIDPQAVAQTLATRPLPPFVPPPVVAVLARAARANEAPADDAGSPPAELPLDLPRAVAAAFQSRVVPQPPAASVAPPIASPAAPVPPTVAAADAPAGTANVVSPTAGPTTSPAAPAAGAAPVAEPQVLPDVEVAPPVASELPALPAVLLAVPGIVADTAAEAFPVAVPLVGMLPTDAEAIEQAAAALVFHVSALADTLPDAVTAGPEGYAWVAAGVCLAGGLTFTVRGRRVRRPVTDPVTLGTDSVYALEARRDTDLS